MNKRDESNQKVDVSIVVPCYNTKYSICCLYERIQQVFTNSIMEYELIFVDDSSPQLDYEEIVSLASNDYRVKLIKLSKNFGQQAAITAGLKVTKGLWVIVMDADLQDKPEDIPRFYNKAKEGYEIVYSKVVCRRDSYFKMKLSNMFRSVFAYFTGSKVDYGIRNFGIYSRKVIDNLLLLDEQYRGFALLVRWLGFKHTVIDVQHDRREIGISSYNLTKGLNLAIDSLLTFSDRPLRFTTISGFIVSFISMLAGFIFLARGLLGYNVLLGWTSLILSIWFLSGFTVFCLGLIGLYVGRVFSETKKRPHYIVDFTINIDEEV